MIQKNYSQNGRVALRISAIWLKYAQYFIILDVEINVEIYATRLEQANSNECVQTFYQYRVYIKQLPIGFHFRYICWSKLVLFALVQRRCFQMINFKPKVHLTN